MSTPTRPGPPMVRTADEERPHWRATCKGCGAHVAGAVETVAGGAKQAEAFVRGTAAMSAKRIVSRVEPGDPDYPVKLSRCSCPEAAA